MNCANFKQAVLQMARSHRRTWQLHEADLARDRARAEGASVTRQVLGEVLARRRQLVARAQPVARQARDELGRRWWRGSAHERARPGHARARRHSAARGANPNTGPVRRDRH
jgi:hypothetical protein